MISFFLKNLILKNTNQTIADIIFKINKKYFRNNKLTMIHLIILLIYIVKN